MLAHQKVGMMIMIMASQGSILNCQHILFVQKVEVVVVVVVAVESTFKSVRKMTMMMMRVI